MIFGKNHKFLKFTVKGVKMARKTKVMENCKVTTIKFSYFTELLFLVEKNW